MKSFGSTKTVHNEDGRNFETTFKIQGQVYQRIGSLLPMPDTDLKFLQIYFMGDEEQQIHTRCVYNHIERTEERETVDILETFCKTIKNWYDVQDFFLQTAKRQHCHCH